MPLYAKRQNTAPGTTVSNIADSLSASLAYRVASSNQGAPTYLQNVNGPDAWAWHYLMLRSADITAEETEPPPPDPPPGTSAGYFFTGTFPDTIYRQTSPGVTPVLVGGSPQTVGGVGTFTAVNGGINFAPVEGFPTNTVASVNYTVSGGPTETAQWQFDPFYWDGHLPRGSAPTPNATVTPAGLAAAITAASAGHVIHVTDGTTATRITVNKALTIWSVNKYGAKFSNGFSITASNVTLNGVEVTNAPSSSTDGVSVVATNFTMRHCKVQTPSGRQNLYINNGSHNPLIESCDFIKPDGSVYSRSESLALTFGFGNEGRNIVTSGSNNTVFRNCFISGSLYRGIVMQNTDGLLMEHCWFEKSRAKGIYAYRVNNARFINNRVFNPGDPGIQVNECFATAAGTGLEISYNTIWSSNPLATDRGEDTISIFKSGGLANKKFHVRKNRSWHFGASVTGSAGMTGDGGGGHIEYVENVIVNAGQVGSGIFGGSYIAMRRNKIWGDHPNTVGKGSQGMYVWKGGSHEDSPGGVFYGWGNHVHEANKIYFRIPDGTFKNLWINNPEGVTGTGTNLLGSAGNQLGMSANIIYQF